MRLKTLVAFAVAAAFAAPLVTQAQSDKPSSGTSGSSDSGAVPAKCAALTGTDREKCLREERGGAGGSGGSTSSSPISPSTSPSPSGSGSTSGSGSEAPKKQ